MDHEKLKALRDGRGWSQQRLAGEAGLSLSMVAALEQGKKPNPRVDTMLRLARALGCGVADLLPPPAEAPAPRKKGGKHARTD